MSSGFPFSLAPPNRLRRSVVDPETGNAVVTSGAADEAHPDPNAITSRSWLLPLGRTASGAVVPAAQAPVKFVGDLGKAVVGSIPDAVPQAIDAVKWIGDIAAGRKGVFDPTTGHVSDEALGNAFGAAGVAMTGSMPLKAPKGALRSFGGAAAKDDPLAALEAGLSGFTPETPLPGPRRMDPNAKSWDVYHGSGSGPDFQRFDPTVASNPAERGGVFFAPDPETASAYASGPGAPGEAGSRVFRATVDPGRTKVFDLGLLAETDPSFNALAREITTRDSGLQHGATFDRYMDGFHSNRAEHRELSAQAEAMGYSASPPDGISWGHGHIGAALQRARDEGLDTAIIRGTVEHGGDDQVVALTPGRVRSFYSPDHLLYSGGRGGGPAGAAALALPGEDRATPSNAQEKTMSAGALPGFGLIPNAGPDDLRRLLRLMPLDPSQGVPIMDAGGTPGAEEPRGLQGQMPRAPSPPGGLLDMADLTGPAGAQIHHPGTAKPGGLQSAIAMDEADTQRLEQQTGMMPPAPATGGLLSELFGKAPMGAPQSFSGTSGTVMPGQGPDLSGSPMPPARPSAADLAAPAPAARPLGFGSLAPPRPARPQQADMPAPGAVPVAGQTPQAAPTTPGAGPAAIPSAAPAAPGSAPPGTPGAEEPSFLDKVGSGFRRFSENGGGDLLGSIGMGLMSTPGFGQGLAAGLKNYQGVSERKEARDLAKQEFGLRIQKAAQEATGLKGNQAFIKMAFPNLTPEQVVAGASNSTLVSAAIAKMQNPNAGREMKADSSGVNRWVDTGQPVFKDDEGKADWEKVSLPDGGTMLYSKSDPSKTQVLVQGQPARPATEDELRAFRIPPGQAAKMTREGPVLLGGASTPQVKTFEQPDGSKVERQWDPQTNTWGEPNYGANRPTTQAPSNPYATGKFNEGQGKAAGFTDRMMGSEPILRDLEGVKQGMLRGTAEGFLPNGWKTEDRQKLEQAQRDFINAQLRRESGAAISPSEFTNAEKQYFPQPGDTDAVVSQKRANRQRAIEAMGRESGPAYAPSKKFDEKGSIVPSMTPDSRFKQLRGAGLSKEDAYARMHTEGY